MPIPFTCPHCGASTEVAEEYAGQSGPCASCGKTITVPPAPGTTAGPARPEHATSATLVTCAVVVGLVVIVLGLLLLIPVLDAPIGPRPGTQCINNLKQIGLALHNYHDAYGSFPPAYITDEQGTPLYSWRVLILPYLEESNLYDQFHLDEPWDSPHNRALSEEAVYSFRCPNDSGNKTDTSYVMVVGPGAISDGPTAKGFQDIHDGSSNTIIVVEMSESGIHWMEPRDLDVTTMSYKINDPNGVGIRSLHPAGIANVLLGDGFVRSISEDIDPDLLKALITIDGGEPVNEFYEN